MYRNSIYPLLNCKHVVKSGETEMLPRSIPPLTKEEFKEFQKEIEREPSRELVETLKRAKTVYESKAL